MRKIGRNILAAIGAAAALSAATPAAAYSNGVFIAYYYDYPGGTPAGYRLYCNGGLWESYGDETGIFYIVYDYPFCP